MDRSRVIPHYIETGFSSFVKKNSILLVFSAVYLIFYIVGCIIYRNLTSNQLDFIGNVTSIFIRNRNGLGFLEVCINSFFSSFWILLLIYISGLLPLSLPIIIPVLIFKSAGLGVMFSFIYSSQLLNGKGIFYVLTILMLPSFLVTLVLLTFSKKAYKMSCTVKSNYKLGATPQNLHYKLKLFSGQFLAFCGFILVSAILEGLLTIIFSPIFKIN